MRISEKRSTHSRASTSSALSSESDVMVNTAPDQETVPHLEAESTYMNDEDDEATEIVFEESDQQEYLESVALFYLKLQCKYLIPASTIQNIIDEMQIVHSIGLSHILSIIFQVFENAFGLCSRSAT